MFCKFTVLFSGSPLQHKIQFSWVNQEDGAEVGSHNSFMLLLDDLLVGLWYAYIRKFNN